MRNGWQARLREVRRRIPGLGGLVYPVVALAGAINRAGHLQLREQGKEWYACPDSLVAQRCRVAGPD